MLAESLPILTIALLMLLVAAALGVCGWVDMIDRIWFIAGVGAAMVALFSVYTMVPLPTREAEQSFPFWFVGTFLVALALNIVAVFLGRAVKRHQDSSARQR
jgi:CDP-diglyceride synthetase